MTEDKFISTGTPLTPYQAELLTILIEECSEVIKRAAKAKRFGLDEIQPGHENDNMERLSYEIGDLEFMIYTLINSNMIDRKARQLGFTTKEKKLRKYLQHSPDDR